MIPTPAAPRDPIQLEPLEAAQLQCALLAERVAQFEAQRTLAQVATTRRTVIAALAQKYRFDPEGDFRLDEAHARLVVVPQGPA